MLYCKNFFENSNYIYKIFGINKFEGYIGYIYPNGRVVMEKFYDDIKNKKVSTLSATYIMNIYNFIEISKLNKIEIIDLIMNNPSSNIYRVYHVKNIKNWAAKVSQYISGNDYTKDVISYIDNLINKNTISKGGKHGFN